MPTSACHPAPRRSRCRWPHRGAAAASALSGVAHSTDPDAVLAHLLLPLVVGARPPVNPPRRRPRRWLRPRRHRRGRCRARRRARPRRRGSRRRGAGGGRTGVLAAGDAVPADCGPARRAGVAGRSGGCPPAPPRRGARRRPHGDVGGSAVHDAAGRLGRTRHHGRAGGPSGRPARLTDQFAVLDRHKRRVDRRPAHRRRPGTVRGARARRRRGGRVVLHAGDGEPRLRTRAAPSDQPASDDGVHPCLPGGHPGGPLGGLRPRGPCRVRPGGVRRPTSASLDRLSRSADRLRRVRRDPRGAGARRATAVRRGQPRRLHPPAPRRGRATDRPGQPGDRRHAGRAHRWRAALADPPRSRRPVAHVRRPGSRRPHPERGT